MEILVIEPNSPQQSETIKAFLKSLKVNFRSSSSASLEAIETVNSIVEGYREAKAIESGQIKAKGYSSFKEMLDEL